MAARKLRCVIVGEGTLPIVCGQLLLERGHRLLALVSPDRHVTDWAQANGIAHAASPAALADVLEDAPFDCLFSAVNFQKLPEPLLAAATAYAVNYHDGPLPRYAGMHATTWAVLDQVAEYAVTWHLMTQRTDAGDILEQVPVEVDPDDTALSLNAKCYEAAVAGFRSMLEDMETGTVAPRPQDQQARTYFRRDQRPAAGCTLPFDAPADHLHALLRALDFGPYWNPMGLPKLALGESFAIVTELEVLDERSGKPPGTLVATGEESLVVSTASDDVELAGFFTIDGAPMTVAEVLEHAQWRVGAHIAPIDAARAARLEALVEGCCRHEAFWLAQLAGAKPLVLPMVGRTASSATTTGGIEVQLPPSVQATAAPDAGTRTGEQLMAAFIVYLVGLTGRRSLDLAFADSRLHADIGDLRSFFSIWLPLCVSVDAAEPFGRFADVLSTGLDKLRKKRTYARDAPLREPSLRARLDALDTRAWPVAMELLDDIHQPLPREASTSGRVLVARFQRDGTRCQLIHDTGAIASWDIERMARQFAELLRTHGPSVQHSRTGLGFALAQGANGTNPADPCAVGAAARATVQT